MDMVDKSPTTGGRRRNILSALDACIRSIYLFAVVYYLWIDFDQLWDQDLSYRAMARRTTCVYGNRICMLLIIDMVCSTSIGTKKYATK